MRKEILFAILAGVLFGAVLAFGIWRANSALKGSSDPAKEATNSPAEQKEDINEIRLSLATPSELDVITQSPVRVTGATKPDTWVAISGEETDYVFKSGPDGSISQEVDLVGGVNQILVVSFDENGQSAEENLTVVFSTKFEKETPDVLPEEENDEEETDAIRKKVQGKLEEARNNPKAYLGSITDILEDTIQIKSEIGEIQQMSIEDDTDFEKVGDTNQTITFSDVAIGDFLIAMGFLNDDGVLNSKRILISSPPDDINRKVFYGEITSIEKKIIELKTQEGQITLEFPKRWKGPEIDELEEGFKVITVGLVEEDEETLKIRTIEIISETEASPTPEEE
ncbi:hypothetical protein IID22_03365 [Patescibacteria group bacterium]|nr:hypothetical protein [Patescibacteria group bacterium]